MKTLQEFSPEYLTQCQKMSTEEIARFLDQFRQIHANPALTKPKSKLISIKVPENLLNAFKVKARLEGVRYQTQIKVLMQEWLQE